MLLKSADPKEPLLQELEHLLTRTDLSLEQRKRIEVDLRNERAGWKTEKEAAYQLGFYLDSHKRWLVLHDLRLEHEGQVAQIDHVVLTPLMDLFLLESKSFSDGVGVNEHGEFVRFYNGRAIGMPSPLEQNRRHAHVLRKMLEDGVIRPPSRLGVPIKPTIRTVVLVSINARISRPRRAVEGIESIVKADQFVPYAQKEMDDSSLLKLVGTESLQAFAHSLMALHRPMKPNLLARYGLSPASEPVGSSTAVSTLPVRPEAAAPGCDECRGEVTPAEARFSRANATRFRNRLLCRACQSKSSVATRVAPVAVAEGNTPAEASRYSCAGCRAGVQYAVAKFCWGNKTRFGGAVYCRACQDKR